MELEGFNFRSEETVLKHDCVSVGSVIEFLDKNKYLIVEDTEDTGEVIIRFMCLNTFSLIGAAFSSDVRHISTDEFIALVEDANYKLSDLCSIDTKGFKV